MAPSKLNRCQRMPWVAPGAASLGQPRASWAALAGAMSVFDIDGAPQLLLRPLSCSTARVCARSRWSRAPPRGRRRRRLRSLCHGDRDVLRSRVRPQCERRPRPQNLNPERSHGSPSQHQPLCVACLRRRSSYVGNCGCSADCGRSGAAACGCSDRSCRGGTSSGRHPRKIWTPSWLASISPRNKFAGSRPHRRTHSAALGWTPCARCTSRASPRAT